MLPHPAASSSGPLEALPASRTAAWRRGRRAGCAGSRGLGGSVCRADRRRFPGGGRLGDAHSRGARDDLPRRSRPPDRQRGIDGENVKTVQARLGHASAAETLDTYSHLWPDSEDRTRTAVDDVLSTIGSGSGQDSERATLNRQVTAPICCPPVLSSGSERRAVRSSSSPSRSGGRAA